ncbi:hypothetical protein LI208_09755 [Longicatena sp. 210702-DFI.1.36]|uniref:phage tail assembly chaperone n=1 Tax=Longicatena TaxID=1918536 RepID=UPI001D065FBB|nr:MULTISPECIES: hypothetical protein [Longicatena]MCB6265536.1 hypothetical protein [Longicatena sp. 210702-DFI.1.160]MCB6316311.1 hypothetical protein [Longicatena sp. 210702-DFI.1.100]MCB6430100.1 hypothetical protein [Longicatena sp. 210702-DFI.1.36]MCB6432981.1 hypothetical protein [Longicatena sp. 210702-DFI.1.249]MCB6439728.1 hypothetical protein [Longicatena sp. 210702-DFI.1.255]
MSDLSRFLKANKIKRENTTFAATKSLVDAKGNPLPWTIKPLTTKENDAIRDECMIEVPVKGKPNMFRPKLDTSKYIGKMICACVVEPNLYDKDLQDSYGVMSPDDLLKEMIDDAGEYQEFATFVQNFNGFNTTLEDKVEEAKN